MIDLPDRYLGALLRNGYFIVEKADDKEEAVFERFLKAAEQGDEIAQHVLDRLPFLHWMVVMLARRTGIHAHRVGGDSHSIQLRCGTYPPAFSGRPYDYLADKAKAGDYLATRFVAWIALQKFTNPDFEVHQ